MDKYAQRVMEEVYHTFSNHYKDQDERIEFLTNLIETLQNELEQVKEIEREPETSFFNYENKK